MWGDRAVNWLEAHKAEALASKDYDEFCSSQGPLGEHYRKYVWLRNYYRTLKAKGFLTYHPLEYPEARTFADLFTAAKLLPTQNKTEEHYGLFFLGGSGATCGHFGGRRGIKTFPDGSKVKSNYSSQFLATYVKPNNKLYNDLALKETQGSFDAIRLEDGILIIHRDKHCIGNTWVALLDLTENIETMFSEETKEFLAKERQAEKEAWGELDKTEV